MSQLVLNSFPRFIELELSLLFYKDPANGPYYGRTHCIPHYRLGNF